MIKEKASDENFVQLNLRVPLRYRIAFETEAAKRQLMYYELFGDILAIYDKEKKNENRNK